MQKNSSLTVDNWQIARCITKIWINYGNPCTKLMDRVQNRTRWLYIYVEDGESRCWLDLFTSCCLNDYVGNWTQNFCCEALRFLLPCKNISYIGENKWGISVYFISARWFLRKKNCGVGYYRVINFTEILTKQ